MRSYNDPDQSSSQSNESSISSNEQKYKATTTYGKISKIVSNEKSSKYQKQNSASSESSLQEDDEDEVKEQRPKLLMGGKHSQSQEEQSDDSIDHIEERIKRLEKDLEKRIDKHKQESSDKKKVSKDSEVPQIVKNKGSPPLPKKNQLKHSLEEQQKINNNQIYSQNRNKMNIQTKMEQKVYKQAEDKQIKPLSNIAEEEEQKGSPQKKKIKKSTDPAIIYSKNPISGYEKKRTQSKNSHSQVSVKANKQIDQLQRTIQQLKHQNKKLKDQISFSQNKKRPLQELQKLKQLSDSPIDKKLQKQIELLKVIQSLQAKLKKSIQKKLSKGSKNNASVALMHKGLPSSLLN